MIKPDSFMLSTMCGQAAERIGTAKKRTTARCFKTGMIRKVFPMILWLRFCRKQVGGVPGCFPKSRRRLKGVHSIQIFNYFFLTDIVL